MCNQSMKRIVCRHAMQRLTDHSCCLRGASKSWKPRKESKDEQPEYSRWCQQLSSIFSLALRARTSCPRLLRAGTPIHWPASFQLIHWPASFQLTGGRWQIQIATVPAESGAEPMKVIGTCPEPQQRATRLATAGGGYVLLSDACRPLWDFAVVCHRCAIVFRNPQRIRWCF